MQPSESNRQAPHTSRCDARTPPAEAGPERRRNDDPETEVRPWVATSDNAPHHLPDKAVVEYIRPGTEAESSGTQTPICCERTAAALIQLRSAPPPFQWGPESSAPLEPMCISGQIDPIAASITWSAAALLIPRWAAMSGTM